MVSGVVTQPKNNGNTDLMVVTRYDVEYSVDDQTWVNLGTFVGPTV